MIGVRSGLAEQLKGKILQWLVDSVLFIEVRWLSKGNMLTRLHELKEEAIIFLEFKEKHDSPTMFQWNLPYLTNISSDFDYSNTVCNCNVIVLYCIVFYCKFVTLKYDIFISILFFVL
nr:unnamed protein product [Callosobruchus analis]